MVLLDGDLTVLDQQEYLVIGKTILTVRISYSVDVGNATMFEESLDFVRLGLGFSS